jgi:4-oxalocrotonate tautomerase
MPLARIDLIKGKPAQYRQAVQVIAEHDAANFIYDPNFFGISRSKDVIFVQLTLAEGRTLEQKRAFYKRLVDDLHDRLGVRKEDVFVSLVGTGREDWSFGNGEASLVKS